MRRNYCSVKTTDQNFFLLIKCVFTLKVVEDYGNKIYCPFRPAEIVVVKIKCFNIFSGFRMNPSSWPSFLQKTLTGAVVASDSCFKKVIIKIVFHSYDLHTETMVMKSL